MQGAESTSSAGGEEMSDIGPMMSEMSHGDEVVQAAEEFERRSRKMKDHLTVKVSFLVYLLALIGSVVKSNFRLQL